MVTWGHITKLGNPVDTWAASFKMAIFFVAAGYLIQYADSYRTQTLKGYAVKLLKSLMLPYVLFSILSILISFAYDIFIRTFTVIIITIFKIIIF